jgi:hypothetical protein
MFRSIGIPETIIIVLILFAWPVVTTIPLCRITERTGYSGWWGLLNLLPFGTLAWACFMAFSKWPCDASPR